MTSRAHKPWEPTAAMRTAAVQTHWNEKMRPAPPSRPSTARLMRELSASEKITTTGGVKKALLKGASI